MFGAGPNGEGTGDLCPNDLFGVTRFAFSTRLAHTEYHPQSRPQPGFRLGFDNRIAFKMVRAAFGMADNHITRPGVAQHFGGNIPGMRAFGIGMTILSANGEA